jgi:molybdenum cofactor biosynthesis enzyme MoaA
MEFDPAGWVYGCCSSQLYPLGRIGAERLSEIWSGQRAQVLRDALRSWDLSVACAACRWHLDHGRPDPVAAVYDQFETPSLDPAGPQLMVFALSNRCNLGCIMCTPELSSTLRRSSGQRPLPRVYGDEFFEDLEPLLADLRQAKFLGGEPFLVNEHFRVWELLSRLEEPPRVQVTTNGTVWNERVEWVLDRFTTDISISIDAATPATYSRVRRGGDLGNVLNNVARFRSWCDASSAHLHVSYCLMEQNAAELAQFLAWAEQFEVEASINLVTDVGLALYDLETSKLEELRDIWQAQDHAFAHGLRRNAQVWETQRRQLDAVLVGRRVGAERPAAQARPAQPDEFQPLSPSPKHRRWKSRRTDAAVAAHFRQLIDWSEGGPVAHLRIEDGVVVEVVSPHPRLGLSTERLIGRSLTDVPGEISAVDGRPVWIIDREELDGGTVVRVLALSVAAPVRGSAAAVLRAIEIPVERGSVLLIAEDRMYDKAPTEVRVRVGTS